MKILDAGRDAFGRRFILVLDEHGDEVPWFEHNGRFVSAQKIFELDFHAGLIEHRRLTQMYRLLSFSRTMSDGRKQSWLNLLNRLDQEHHNKTKGA